MQIKIQRPVTQANCTRRFDETMKALRVCQSAMSRPRTVKIRTEYAQGLITILNILGLATSFHQIGNDTEITAEWKKPTTI